MDKLYTARELSEILKVSPRSIYRLAEQGQLESYRIGRSIRFTMPKPTERNNNGCTKSEIG